MNGSLQSFVRMANYLPLLFSPLFLYLFGRRSCEVFLLVPAASAISETHTVRFSPLLVTTAVGHHLFAKAVSSTVLKHCAGLVWSWCLGANQSKAIALSLSGLILKGMKKAVLLLITSINKSLFE